MLLQELVPESDQLKKKILLKSDLKVKVRSQAKFIDKLQALNENQIFIYFDTGEFELYDFGRKQIVKEGKLIQGIRQFYQIYPNNICYIDPQSIKIQLFDFESGKIDENFSFEASQYVQGNSDGSKKEQIVDKYRVIPLEAPDCKYLICMDLQKHYSNENTCTFILRRIPKEYKFGQVKTDQLFARYDYPNRTQQTEFFNYQVDGETVAFYGMDFETGQAEILLCKPHLGERAFKIILVKDTQSFTLINVTNWYEPHKIALWQNNNDGNTKPTIFVLDMRGYYDGEKWLQDPEYTPTIVPGIFGSIPETFMDIYSFPFGGNLILQFKLIGVDPRLSLIDLQKRKVIDTYVITDFYHELPQNRGYLLQFNDQEIKDGYIYFNVIFSVDARYRLLQLMEQSGTIEKYGERTIIEMFEFNPSQKDKLTVEKFAKYLLFFQAFIYLFAVVSFGYGNPQLLGVPYDSGKSACGVNVGLEHYPFIDHPSLTQNMQCSTTVVFPLIMLVSPLKPYIYKMFLQTIQQPFIVKFLSDINNGKTLIFSTLCLCLILNLTFYNLTLRKPHIQIWVIGVCSVLALILSGLMGIIFAGLINNYKTIPSTPTVTKEQAIGILQAQTVSTTLIFIVSLIFITIGVCVAGLLVFYRNRIRTIGCKLQIINYYFDYQSIGQQEPQQQYENRFTQLNILVLLSSIILLIFAVLWMQVALHLFSIGSPSTESDTLPFQEFTISWIAYFLGIFHFIEFSYSERPKRPNKLNNFKIYCNNLLFQQLYLIILHQIILQQQINKINNKITQQQSILFKYLNTFFILLQEGSRFPTEMTQSKRLRQPIQSEYEKEKRIDHFNLIANSYRERILSNNLVSLCGNQNMNKVRKRSKQLQIIRPQYDPTIVRKIQQTKQDIHINKINLRTRSDHLMSTRKQSLQEFQMFSSYNRNEQKNNKLQILNSFIVKRNEIKINQINIEQDDESVVSETEAKLNGLYGQSKKLQKMVLKKKENPNRIIQFMSKIEQIKESINKVNSGKLKQKFLI